MALASLYIFIGGGLGAVLRFLLSRGAQLWLNSAHWGTLAVNVLGASVLFLLHKKGLIVSKNMDMAIKVGLLGGLTTFSSFSLEIFQFIQQENYLMAAGHFGLNIVFGIIVLVLIFR